MENSRSFVHLHLHTTYSLLDGAVRLGDPNREKEKDPKKREAKEYGLVNRLKELNMNAVAVTDHGNMYGVLDFYERALKAGIKPILGCEVYMAPTDRRSKDLSPEGKRSYHLVLLAQNYQGYKNLSKLVSLGHLEGFYYNPRIDKEILREHSEGLICLSACLAGELAQKCIAKRYDEARAVAKEFQEIFEDRYYIELQMNGIDTQLKINPILAEIARDLGIPLVATNDVHYLRREDAEAQDVLMAISTHKCIDDPNRLKHEVDEFYLKSPEEMYSQFAEWPEACENTVKIAESCDLELPLGKHFFPIIKSEKGIDNKTYLEQLAREGLEKRLEVIKEKYPPEKFESVRQKYYQRLEHELKIIAQMGFSDYFLIVSDFINWAKDQGIPVGPGRGSAAGSLVAYSIRITDIDPIEHDLLFERFLNPERVSMPDIDVDFCEARRDEVIEYVRKKYAHPDGPAVAQIVTFGKMKAKAVVRDVARAYGLTPAETDKLAKLIPSSLNITLREAIEQEPRIRDLIEKDPKIAKIFEMSLKLEGFNRHTSVHAAGVVISDGRPLYEHLPLAVASKGEIVTQFDMVGVEKIGLIKFDFLGLKNLTLIDNCLRLIEKNRGEKIDISKIPLDCEKTFDLLCRGDTIGVFQLESSGMRNVMVKLKPSCFDDVIALVALYRPGPLQGGVVDSFIRRKHGEEEITYLFPELEPILKSTYGVCIYQEQVMQIANVIANYSLGEADLLRRAMAKKKAEEMAKQRERFLKGAKENGFDVQKAAELFDILAKFAEYGFNRSHSAAYGLIAYQTAWLKANYRCEYMASLLTADAHNTDKVLLYLEDCHRADIEILPPDINISQREFTVENGKIRFGFSAIKNVGSGAVDAILEAREKDGPFESLVDFCQRIDLRRVNRRVIEALIKSGCFDNLGHTRAAMYEALDDVIQHAQAYQREKKRGQFSLFGGINGGSNSSSASQFTYQIPHRDEWLEKQKLLFEKEALGVYLSSHPLARYRNHLPALTSHSIADLQEYSGNGSVSIAGVFSSITEKVTKKGDRMAFAVFEDLSGSVEVSIFPDTYRKYSEHLESETALLLVGNIERNERGVKLIAKEITPIEQAISARAKKFYIRFSDSSGLSPQQMEVMFQILKKYPGQCPSYISLRIEDKAETLIALPDELKISPTEKLVEDLERLFGYNPTYIR